MVDPSYYSGLAAEGLAKFRRLGALTRHAGSIGTHHEEVVRELIRPMLSRRFSLRTGFAYLDQEAVSRQGDILLIDETDPSPYLFQMGDLVVVQPRAVAVAIEVKTSLSRETFHESLRNLRSFKVLANQSRPPGLMMTALFAFEGARLTPDTLDEWYKSADVVDDCWSYPQVIYVLQQGTLHLERILGTQAVAHRFVLGEEDDELKSRGLSIFLQSVMKALEQKAGLQANPFEQADLRGIRFSQQHLQIRQGLVDFGASPEVAV